jgi:hypothetical protein
VPVSKSGEPVPRVEYLLGERSDPLRARETVERLLLGVPAADLKGLAAVRLRSREDLSRAERLKRQKAGTTRRLLGTYYHARPNQPGASIDLFIDEIAEAWPFRLLLRLRFFRDVALARVLYHELGHHVDARVSPGTRSKEAHAERYRKSVTRQYFGQSYPWLRSLAHLVKGLRRSIRDPGKA